MNECFNTIYINKQFNQKPFLNKHYYKLYKAIKQINKITFHHISYSDSSEKKVKNILTSPEKYLNKTLMKSIFKLKRSTIVR